MERSIVDTIKEAVFGLTGDTATSEAGPNAIDLLKEDHKKVEGLFKQFEESSGKRQRGKLLEQILSELNAHATAEEKLVYPLLAQEGDKTREAYEEHHVVKLLLVELAEYDGSEENVSAKVKVLSELVKHHVKEEEGELLPKLKESGVDLHELGRKIQSEKSRVQSSGAMPSAKVASARTTKSAAKKSAPQSASKGRSSKSAASKSGTKRTAAARSAGMKSKSTSKSSGSKSAASRQAASSKKSTSKAPESKSSKRRKAS